MNRTIPPVAAVVAILATTVPTRRVAGQVDAEPLPTGSLVERIVASSDTTKSYALYLPSKYDAARQWPILFAMDPRGRALIPLRLFREAAERLGYIVVSSYDTRSDQDDALDVNYAAMEAMLQDTQRRFSLDTRRLYLAGFSGTARTAWEFARMLSNNVPGIIGFGAGFPFPSASVLPLWDRSLVFFGGSGLADFNYEEMRLVAHHLTDYGFRHRIVFYPGPHAWPDADVASRALEWMEMQAMRRELTPQDPDWLAEYATVRLERARVAEEDGDLFAALQRYEALVTDLDGLTDVSGAREELERLSKNRSVRREQSRRDRLGRENADFKDDLRKLLVRMQDDRNPPSLERAMHDLDLEKLLERASRTDDELDALAARRMLESAFVNFAFYAPQRYFALGDHTRALAALRVARAIRPERGDVCFNLARAHARLDQPDEAFEALNCAVDNGWRDVNALRTHPDLESLRSSPEYQVLLQRLAR